jgi:hypothetical protein
MNRNYFDNLDYIKQFKKIVVTGAHGAGNKITAKIIANDTGLPYLRCENPWDTEDYWDSTYGLRQRFYEINRENPDGWVLFSPSQAAHLHRLKDEELKDALIVFVYKDMESLKQYWVRNPFIRFSTHRYESRVRGQVVPEDFPSYKHIMKWEMEEQTYELWEQCQKPLMNNWVEIEHPTLEGHPMFLTKKDRKGFKPWQTLVNQKGHN